MSLPHRPSVYVPWPSSANSNGIHWYTNATSQQQRAKHKEKLIGLVLCQVIEIENLDDVGPTVPEKIDVQRQIRKTKGFPRIPWRQRCAPFDRTVIHTNSHNIHLVEKRQAIRANPRLRLVPLTMRHIHTAVWAWLIPHLPPARAHEQDVALLDVHLLCLGRVLEIVETDPVPAGERILSL